MANGRAVEAAEGPIKLGVAYALVPLIVRPPLFVRAASSGKTRPTASDCDSIEGADLGSNPFSPGHAGKRHGTWGVAGVH
jgi:hypothetical protein